MSDSKMFHKLAIILLPVFSALLMLNFALGVNAARTTFTNNLPDGYHWGDWLSGGGSWFGGTDRTDVASPDVNDVPGLDSYKYVGWKSEWCEHFLCDELGIESIRDNFYPHSLYQNYTSPYVYYDYVIGAKMRKEDMALPKSGDWVVPNLANLTDMIGASYGLHLVRYDKETGGSAICPDDTVHGYAPLLDFVLSYRNTPEALGYTYYGSDKLRIPLGSGWNAPLILPSDYASHNGGWGAIQYASVWQRYVYPYELGVVAMVGDPASYSSLDVNWDLVRKYLARRFHWQYSVSYDWPHSESRANPDYNGIPLTINAKDWTGQPCYLVKSHYVYDYRPAIPNRYTVRYKAGTTSVTQADVDEAHDYDESFYLSGAKFSGTVYSIKYEVQGLDAGDTATGMPADVSGSLKQTGWSIGVFGEAKSNLSKTDGDVVNATATYESKSFLVPSAPTAPGYDFVGWFNEDGTPYTGWTVNQSAVAQSKKVIAKFERKQFKLYFDFGVYDNSDSDKATDAVRQEDVHAKFIGNTAGYTWDASRGLYYKLVTYNQAVGTLPSPKIIGWDGVYWYVNGIQITESTVWKWLDEASVASLAP